MFSKEMHPGSESFTQTRFTWFVTFYNSGFSLIFWLGFINNKLWKKFVYYNKDFFLTLKKFKIGLCLFDITNKQKIQIYYSY